MTHLVFSLTERQNDRDHLKNQRQREWAAAFTNKGEPKMTRDEAVGRVRERWDRLGISVKDYPRVFDADVENMLAENPEPQPQIYIMATKPSLLKSLNVQDDPELAEQYRQEENDAAEEGAAIEASGYQFPEYERNGR